MYTKINLFSMFVCGMLFFSLILQLSDGKWDYAIFNLGLLLLNVGVFMGSVKVKI